MKQKSRFQTDAGKNMSFEKERLARHKRFPVKITKGVNVLSGVRNYPNEKDPCTLLCLKIFKYFYICMLNVTLFRH